MLKHAGIIIATILWIAACKKEKKTATPDPAPAPMSVKDTIAPVITLKGSKSDTILLGKTYTDPGAIATDDVDGNITTKIVITGSVNTNLKGVYTQTYTVKDAAGNEAAPWTRTVLVRNSMDYLNGSYKVTCDLFYQPCKGCASSQQGDTIYYSIFTASSTEDGAFNITPLKGGPGLNGPYYSSAHPIFEITSQTTFDFRLDFEQHIYINHFVRL